MTKKQKRASVQKSAAELMTAAAMFMSKPPEGRREAEEYRMVAQDAMDNLRVAIQAAFPKEPIRVLPPVQVAGVAGEENTDGHGHNGQHGPDGHGGDNAGPERPVNKP